MLSKQVKDEVIYKECPYCNNSNWNYQENREKGVYHCWICGKGGRLEGGNKMKDITFSVKLLEKYHQNLLNSPERINYLEKERLISNNIIKQKKLGLKWDNEDLLVIPYFEEGKFVSWKMRSFERKYFLNPSGVRLRMYNWEDVKHYEELFVFEGELDCLTALSLGLENSVAVPSAGFPPPSENGVSRRIFNLVLDNDKAGDEGCKKWIQSYLCKRVLLPKKDFTDFVKEYTLDDFLYIVNNTSLSCPEGLISYEEALKNKDRVFKDVILTQWDSINNLLGGLYKGQLMIIYGEVKSGKTVFGLNIASFLANQSHPVLFLCLEMSPSELSYIVSKIIPNSSLPLYFVNKAIISSQELCNIIRVMNKQFNAEVVFIDNLQLLLSDMTQVLETGNITRELKNLARELNISIVLFSQTRKEESQRGYDVFGSKLAIANCDTLLKIIRKEGRNDFLLKYSRWGRKGQITLHYDEENFRFCERII